MLSGKRGTNVRRLFILVCTAVLVLGLFNTTALASSSAYRLSGRWSCYYSFSLYWNQQVTEEEYYTFYGIIDNKGNFIHENVTQGYTAYGEFILTEYSDHTVITLSADGFDEMFTLTWGSDGETFTLFADDISLSHFMKQ